MMHLLLAVWLATAPISGTRSRITAGDSAVLEIRDIPAGQILTIEADMRSNKGEGAGSMRLTVGDEVYYSIPEAPYSSPLWAGRYSNVEWDTLRWERMSPVRTAPVRLVVHASHNSLYLGQLRVCYRPEGTQPYTVSLWNRKQIDELLTESSIGSGVVLPSVPGADGWMTHPVLRDSVRPDCLAPGSCYYPERDDTLYALYPSAVDTVVPDTMRTLTEGDYLVFAPLKRLWMRGPLSQETTMADTADYTTWMPTDGRYHLSVLSDSVGVLGGVKCMLQPGYEHTWFITRSSDRRCLWARTPIDDTPSCFGWYKYTYDPGSHYLYLFSATSYPDRAPETYWTTFPDGVGWQDIRDEQCAQWKKVCLDGHIYIIRYNETNRIVYSLFGHRLY